MKNWKIIGLGGSLIFKKKKDLELNLVFLKKFRDLILKFIDQYSFFIVVGGGRLARFYQHNGSKFKVSNQTLDELGIKATWLNAELIRALFEKYAYSRIFNDFNQKIPLNYKICVGAGVQPGRSTDYDLFYFAKLLKVKEVIVLTNVSYIYPKDPQKYRNQRPLKSLSWSEYLKIISNKKWIPGLSLPVDPLASRLAQKEKIKMILLGGKVISKLNKYLSRGEVIGTVVQ